MKYLCLLLINLYQRTISPLIPARCRFYPTCSSYFYEAVSRYGVIKGLKMGIIRVLKCHPFHPGGYDPVK